MAEVNPPGFLQNAGSVNTAEILRGAIQGHLTGVTGAAALRARGGVHPSIGNTFKVQQAGSPNMSVDVLSGFAMVPGSEGTKQANYACLLDATKNIAITASNPTNPRIDIIVAKVQDSFYSGATDAWSVVVVTGTPAGSPVAPTAPANSITLATIAVGAGVTSIVNANIGDVRPYYVSPGGVLSVGNQTERDALGSSLYEGFVVFRRDTDSLEIWNLSTWIVVRDKGSGGVSAQATTSGSDTTASTTYVNMAGTGSVTSFSFTKKAGGTKVRLTMGVGWTATTATSQARFGMQLNGVDYDITQQVENVGGVGGTTGSTIVGAGVVGAGVYTIQGRWRRSGGTGTLNRGINEWLSMDAVEID